MRLSLRVACTCGLVSLSRVCTVGVVGLRLAPLRRARVAHTGTRLTTSTLFRFYICVSCSQKSPGPRFTIIPRGADRCAAAVACAVCARALCLVPLWGACAACRCLKHIPYHTPMRRT